jgi:FAD:protein FMN transferase
MRRVEQVMGTAVSLDLADPLPAERLSELADEVFGWLHEVDRRFSTYRPDSEVSRLGRGELSRQDCSADLRHVLDECGRLWSVTGGWFDAHATGRFDPSGYVKGWSVQVAVDRLVAAGVGDLCLNAGGDICVRGRSAAGRPWRIGVRHPVDAGRLAWVTELTGGAIATSGGYERGAHVLDPFTGRGADGLLSVTVAGPDLALADAYATAAFAMGRAGPGWLAGLDGWTWAAITADGQSYGTLTLAAP